MKIKFKGKKRQYELTGDDKQFILAETVKAKIGQRKGQTIVSPIGYFANLDHVLNKIVHLELIDSDSETFADLLQAITDTRNYIRALVSENPELPDLVA